MSGRNKVMFVPSKPYQHSTMLGSKARAYPDRNTFQVFYSKVGSWPYTHYTRLEKYARDKHVLKPTTKNCKLRS